MQPEHHFRKTEPRIVDGDPCSARQRHLEPAAEAEAVDHGDARNLQRLQPVDDAVRAADRRFDLARIGGTAELVDVGAGDEAGCLRRADHDAGGRLAFQRRQDRSELLHHLR